MLTQSASDEHPEWQIMFGASQKYGLHGIVVGVWHEPFKQVEGLVWTLFAQLYAPQLPPG